MIHDYYPEIEQISVIFWDLNGLKTINDKYGHAMGDRAIDKLSSTLYTHSSENCRVYRIGGDEFVVIIDNPKQEAAEKIVDAVNAQLDIINQHEENEELKVSSAYGFAYGPGKDILEVVKKADFNMYENKRQSKEGRH